MEAPTATEGALIFEKILTIEHVGHGVARMTLVVTGGQVERDPTISVQTGNGMGTGQMQATARNVQITIHGLA